MSARVFAGARNDADLDALRTGVEQTGIRGTGKHVDLVDADGLTRLGGTWKDDDFDVEAFVVKVAFGERDQRAGIKQCTDDPDAQLDRRIQRRPPHLGCHRGQLPDAARQ